MCDPALAQLPFLPERNMNASTESARQNHLTSEPSESSAERHTKDTGLHARHSSGHFSPASTHSYADRFQLLLRTINQITSNLELSEVLRSISISLREIMKGDIAAVSLYDAASGQMNLFVLDYPDRKGFAKEGLLMPLIGPGKTVFETRRPMITRIEDLHQLGPEVHAELSCISGSESICLIPLVNHARVLGILTLSRTTKIQFSQEEVDFLCQIAGPISIAIENAFAFKEISELKEKLAQEKSYLEEEIRSEMGFEQIIGNCAAIKQALHLVETVSPSDSTVLILGETGTGKELIARAVHERSRRTGRTFVKLNCAAIPTGLLESELFGHEKGAFTGAISQKAGRMELADQGTLFLDEVGDIPIEIQPKLLRVLQEREFERLGSTHTRKVNVRLVAATNRNLEKMVADREFRSDLFYRLNVFPIKIPPLRERREDIPLLAKYFVQKIAKQMEKRIDSIPASVLKGLAAWDWPGNIRELENFIERAVILTRGRTLEAPLCELYKTKVDEPTRASVSRGDEEIARIVKETVSSLNGKRDMDEHVKKQREDIVRVLTECKGRIGGPNGVAARMGISRTTLISRIKRLGINPYQYAFPGDNFS